MSELAASHLKQARIAARRGDPDRAVELLEQARVLVGDDALLREQVLAQLAELYEVVGRQEEAAQCRAQPARPELKSPPPPSGNSPALLYGGIAAGVLVLILAGFVVRHVFSVEGSVAALAPAPAPPAPAPRVVVPSAQQVAVVAQPPATRPVPPPVVVHPAPVVPSASAVAGLIFSPIGPTPAATSPSASPLGAMPRATPKLDREDLLRETVGLCVVVARYEGPVADVGSVRIDMPLGSGTAFAVNSLGLMLTNRHVVEAAKEASPPANLEKLKLPTLTRRDISYVICFGPNPKDRFTAKLLHKSERYDLAILKIDRRVEHPLVISQKNPRQGDDILVCGYPGAVMAALNAASDTPAQLNDLKEKWESTRHVDAFDGFNPDSFSSTLTKGIVSAANRNVEDASYLQIDAGISPGNSGGPVLNVDNEVVGIATWGISQAPAGIHASYNFALRVGQLNEEIQPYLKN